jgi:CRP/FNR family transcriptional regulator, cyclic AMP receptor protein
MAIEKCINEFDVDDVIFEEGSTGRELFVVLDARSNFEPIMQSVRDLNKLDDG